MKRLLLILALLALCISASAQQPSIEGTWLGTLSVSGNTLRVVFNISKTPAGFTATLDSPDQGAKGIPVASATLQSDSVVIDAPVIGGNFKGKLSGDSIEGTWSQGGMQLPLLLKRTTEPVAARRRPQDPVKPYPYREEDVTFENKAAAIKLAGTLTLPQNKGPYTAVVLISGSGPQNRDLEVFGHRPFLVLSDYLTRKGIAVLRVDDRGVGKSEGNFSTATTADFATDVEAAVAYLKTRPEIDAHRIGLIGLSEGGIIAPMVASRNSDVAFIVMMAGTGVPGAQIIPEQVRLLSRAAGMSADKAEEQAQEQTKIISIVQSEKDPALLQKKLRDALGKQMPEAQRDRAISQFTAPWFRYFLDYDPATALRKIKCPTLVLNGSLDKQVPPAQNLPVIRQALTESGNKHFEIVELPGLNHIFQTAKTGADSEYTQTEETMSPVAMEKISDWIAKN